MSWFLVNSNLFPFDCIVSPFCKQIKANHLVILGASSDKDRDFEVTLSRVKLIMSQEMKLCD